MKKGIAYKIVISYLLIIFMSIVFVGIIFNYATRSFLERQITRNLKNDAYAVGDILAENAANNLDSIQTQVKQLRDELRRKVLGNLASDFFILSKDMKVIFPRENEEIARFKIQAVPALRSRIYLGMDSSIKIPYKNSEYIIFIHPVKGDTGIKGLVAAYAPMTPMR